MDRIESNQGLVHWQAKRYNWCGAPYDELVQEGNIGLMIAAERFDPDRGFQFSTLATWWVRQRIGRYARRYHAQRAVSLDAEDTEGRRMIDRVPGSVSMDPELAVIARQVLSILSPREAAVMALRWDL